MIKGIMEIKDSFLHLFFPHICNGCGSDLLTGNSLLCMRCLNAIPETGFEMHSANPVEKKFYGRLPLIDASAQYYYTKDSLMQRLVQQVKYRGNRDLGLQLGGHMGRLLKQSSRFDVDALIPLPLFPARERKRGYNQSMLLCEGIAQHIPVPVLSNTLLRPHHTETQTKKGRIERWKNMDGKFILNDINIIAGKHVLLVDDVITTGATLEACGSVLLASPGVQLSIACLCYSSH
jgi:ComF family protein